MHPCFLVDIDTALICLEGKKDEAAHSAVIPAEAVPVLEVVAAPEQVDEQPNSVDDSTDELQSMDVRWAGLFVCFYQ